LGKLEISFRFFNRSQREALSQVSFICRPARPQFIGMLDTIASINYDSSTIALQDWELLHINESWSGSSPQGHPSTAG